METYYVNERRVAKKLGSQLHPKWDWEEFLQILNTEIPVPELYFEMGDERNSEKAIELLNNLFNYEEIVLYYQNLLEIDEAKEKKEFVRGQKEAFFDSILGQDYEFQAIDEDEETWEYDPSNIDGDTGDFWIDYKDNTCGFSIGQKDPVTGMFISNGTEISYKFRPKTS